MSQPTFYAGATLGFRKWHLSLEPGAGPPLLRGLANPLLQGLVGYGFDRPRYSWRLKEPNHAGCSRLESNPTLLGEVHGEVPGMDCSCGFYAYGRRLGSNSETTARTVGGVIAGWGSLELHERGFRCGVAKVLALFAPDPEEVHADHDGLARQRWAALRQLCAENAIPLLECEALKNDDEVRRYARERDLALLEEQLEEAA